MKIKIMEKPRNKHVNPPLFSGHVYQELDSKDYYFAGNRMDSLRGERVITLFSLHEGKAWASDGGFGNSGARFIDVTDSSIFMVEI